MIISIPLSAPKKLNMFPSEDDSQFRNNGFQSQNVMGQAHGPIIQMAVRRLREKAVRVSAILDGVIELCYAESGISVLGRASSG